MVATCTSKQDDTPPSTIRDSSTVLSSNNIVQEEDRNSEAYCATPCTDAQQQDGSASLLMYFGLHNGKSTAAPIQSDEHTASQQQTDAQPVHRAKAIQYQGNNATSPLPDHNYPSEQQRLPGFQIPYSTLATLATPASIQSRFSTSDTLPTPSTSITTAVDDGSTFQHSSVSWLPCTMDFTGQDAAPDDALYPAPSYPVQCCDTAKGHAGNGELATMSTSFPDQGSSLYSQQQASQPRYTTAHPQVYVTQYQHPQLENHCQPSSNPNPNHVDVGPPASEDSMSASTHDQSPMIFPPGDIIFTSHVAAANGTLHCTASYADTDSQTYDHGARTPHDVHLSHDTQIDMPPSYQLGHAMPEQPIDAQPVYEAVVVSYQAGYPAEYRNLDMTPMSSFVPADNDLSQMASLYSGTSYFDPDVPVSSQSSPGSSSAPWVPIQTSQGVFDPYQMELQPIDTVVESQPAAPQCHQPIQRLQSLQSCQVTNVAAPIQSKLDGEMNAYGSGLNYESTTIPDIDFSMFDGHEDNQSLMMNIQSPQALPIM
ncbi:hypothetical protein FGRA07_11405 [Fusarium graminearum]|nr:hypothetical protein FGRA07_11405 [Fusarium graminearum]